MQLVSHAPMQLNEALESVGFYQLTEAQKFDLIGILAFRAALEDANSEQTVSDTMIESGFSFSDAVVQIVESIAQWEPSVEQVRSLVVICSSQVIAAQPNY